MAYLDGVDQEKKKKEKEEDDQAEVEISKWVVRRVPGVGANWDPLERWSEVLRLKWKLADHNNLGEIRIMVLALRRLSRSSASWDKRVLLIGDSLVAIGALAKGRSASWPVLRLCRMAAAVQIACGIRPYLRWIPSKRNHADGPSRDFPIGSAPEWVIEADREDLKKRIKEAARAKEVAKSVDLPDTTEINMESFLTAG